MNKEPVVIVMSVLAGLQILTAGSALGDVIGAQAAALIVLAVAAVQAGVQFYVRGKVYTEETVQRLTGLPVARHAKTPAARPTYEEDGPLT